MTTKLFFLAGFAMLFFSCSEDDNNDVAANSDLSFTRFTVTSTTTYADGSLSPDNYSITENLVNQKRFSVTANGETAQRYFYTDGLLVQAPQESPVHFHYDNARLAGADKLINEEGVAQSVTYRYTHPAPNIMYCERTTASYNDPNATIIYRNILEFNADDNVIKAGPDQNLDGVMDHFNQFTYTNGDLVSIQLWNGSIQNFSYSTINDNFNFIDDNTYGKKVRRAMCAELYAGTNWETNLGHSKHLRLNESMEPVFNLLPNGFYQKKTTTTTLEAGAQNETVTEFFFD